MIASLAREKSNGSATHASVVVTADTGDEHPETYEHVERIKRICWERNWEFVHITADMGFHLPSWQSLTGQMYRNDTINEPWVFLVGADGKIAARWDNVVTREAVEPMLQALPTNVNRPG